MERQLQKTVLLVDGIVETATDNIYGVQKNVTRQLHVMGDSLDNTVRRLNADIKDAADRGANEMMIATLTILMAPAAFV